MDTKFVNVLILGFGFMFLFTSFQTMGNIEKTILDSIKLEDPSYKGDGYTSLAVIYTMFSICNWLAPSFLTFSGPRGAMLIGAITYCFYMISFLWSQAWLLYFASVILGAGASITWTGQGTYLTRCSDTNTISRNSSIFWALLQASMFFGNVFVYFQFQNKTIIDKETRTIVVGVLIAIAILGVIFLSTLRPIIDIKSITDTEMNDKPSGWEGALTALREAGKLFSTRNMLLLNLTFFYTGLELSFYSGVYGPSIGFTQEIGDSAKQIVGLAGIFVGIGEVIAGACFGILAVKTNRFGRDPIVIIGYICHIIAFFLIFMNLPNSAPFGNTHDIAYINPPQSWIALLCAFLLGFGDSCFNTQIYSMLGGVYSQKSVGAFALFKFTQSVAAAVSFYYSSHLGLNVQIGILVIFGTIGTICFCIVEFTVKRIQKSDTLSNSNSKNDDDSHES